MILNKSTRLLIVSFFLLILIVSAQQLTSTKSVFQKAGITSAQLTRIDFATRDLLYKVLTTNKTQIEKQKAVVGSPVISQSNNKDFISIFLRSDFPTESRAKIESIGGRVTNVIKNILIADIPLDKLSQIVLFSEVQQIEAATYQEAQLDTSLSFINVDKVHGGIDLPKPYKGVGVIVGVLDSGIDWTHPAFNDENGSRVLYLWDMSDDTAPPAEFSYGTEYEKDDLDQQNSNEIDDNGHGTHVASTAAGNAGGDDYPLDGVAPEADIIFVKGFRAGVQTFASNDIINGCDYIFTRAEQVGKPCVINMSLGSVTGNTGNSLYEEALSSLVEPGKLIVCSAGNSGSSNIHLQYQMTGTSTSERSNTFFTIPDSSRGVTHIFGYPDNDDFHVGIQILDQSFNSLSVTPFIEYDTEKSGTIIINSDTLGTITLSGKPSSEEPYLFNIELNYDEDSGIKNYIYNLYTFGSAFFNAWIYNGTFSTDNDPANNIMPGDAMMTVGSPSSAFNVFSIGAFTTKTSWNDIDGIPRSVGGTITDRAYFSSVGPLRDGRLKPDFSAPGHWIAAGYSKDAGFARGQLVNDKIALLQGTSMSAPHFTGVIALLLEQNPNLTYDQAFEVLQNTAISDDISGSVPNYEFGYGRIDAQVALQQLVTAVDDEKEIPVEFNLTQNYPNPFNPTTSIEYSIPQNELVKIKVYDILGSKIATLVNENKTPGNYKVNFNAAELSSGVYFYTINAGNFHEVRKMMLIK